MLGQVPEFTPGIKILVASAPIMFKKAIYAISAQFFSFL